MNTAFPAATRTPINDDDSDVLARMTAGRPGAMDEIAAAVVWLLSYQSGYVHGAEIALDAGITATATRSI